MNTVNVTLRDDVIDVLRNAQRVNTGIRDQRSRGKRAVFRFTSQSRDRESRGHLEKLISLPIADSPGVRIETGTKRNHSTTILWRATGTDYFSRCPRIQGAARCLHSTISMMRIAKASRLSSSFNLQLVKIPVSAPAGMRAAIEGFATEPTGALVVNPGMSAVGPLELIALSAQFRLPAIYGSRFFPAAGGLMSYNSDVLNLRGVASYVDRLLRGASVSDLPYQFPTKFRLVINLKTARALGLTIPETLLAIADEVIE
jgi:ABC transporter substrate binding protein